MNKKLLSLMCISLFLGIFSAGCLGDPDPTKPPTSSTTPFLDYWTTQNGWTYENGKGYLLEPYTETYTGNTPYPVSYPNSPHKVVPDARMGMAQKPGTRGTSSNMLPLTFTFYRSTWRFATQIDFCINGQPNSPYMSVYLYADNSFSNWVFFVRNTGGEAISFWETLYAPPIKQNEVKIQIIDDVIDNTISQSIYVNGARLGMKHDNITRISPYYMDLKVDYIEVRVFMDYFLPELVFIRYTPNGFKLFGPDTAYVNWSEDTATIIRCGPTEKIYWISAFPLSYGLV